MLKEGVMATTPKSIHGTRWNDTLNGTNNAETIYAGAGDDIINPRGGDDMVDGGAGTDTVLLSGSVDRYSLQWLPDGYLEVSGADGTDKLINVEFLNYGSTTYSTRGPVARSDAFSAHENQTLSMNVLDNDQSLLTGAPLAVQKLGGGRAAEGDVVATTVDGRVDVKYGADGNLVFDPGINYDYLAFGVSYQTTFTYTVGNGTGPTATASVTLTITGDNEDPTTVYPEDNLIIHQDDNLTYTSLTRIGTDGWRDLFVFNFDLNKDSAIFSYIYNFNRGEDMIVVIDSDDLSTYQYIKPLPNNECVAVCGCDYCPPIDSEFVFTDDPGVYSSGYSGVSGIVANSLIGWDDIYVTNDPNYLSSFGLI